MAHRLRPGGGLHPGGGGEAPAGGGEGHPQTHPQDAHGLLAFLAEYLEAPGGLLLRGGEEAFPLVDRVVPAPWWMVA